MQNVEVLRMRLPEQKEKAIGRQKIGLAGSTCVESRLDCFN
jgi:hypothetical protein